MKAAASGRLRIGFGFLLALASAGDSGAAIENLVWIADAPGHMVRMNLGGGRQKLLASPFGAAGLAIDANGTAFVAAASGVFEIDSRGEARAVYPGPAGAHSIVVDAAGALWITTSVPGRTVEKWTREGEFVLAVTDMENPTGIAADSAGSVWVVDSYRRTLTRLGPSGDKLFVVPGGGCEGAVAVDSAGHSWVADVCGIRHVLRYAPDGVLASRHPVPNRSIGALAVDGLGQVWVADPSELGVTVLSPRGEFVRSITLADVPHTLAVDGLGAVWSIGATNGTLERFDPRTGAALGAYESGLRPSARGDLTGFTLASVTMPHEDFDDDGYSNTEEIAEGTNPFSSSSVPRPFLAGNVNARLGRVTDVLFVNDNAGGARRTMVLTAWQPLIVHVDAPPAARGPSAYALFARRGAEEPASPTPLPHGLGEAAFPLPLDGPVRGTVTIANSFVPQRRRRLGAPRVDSGPAPVTVGRRIAGLGRSASFTLQGLIEDPGSLGPGVSVTNAVFVRIE